MLPIWHGFVSNVFAECGDVLYPYAVKCGKVLLAQR